MDDLLSRGFLLEDPIFNLENHPLFGETYSQSGLTENEIHLDFLNEIIEQSTDEARNSELPEDIDTVRDKDENSLPEILVHSDLETVTVESKNIVETKSKTEAVQKTMSGLCANALCQICGKEFKVNRSYSQIT
jgi:hypothetical protein